MQTLILLCVGAALVSLGGLFGFQMAVARERKAGGGKTAGEIKTELESYRGNVSNHFMETAHLLHGMTEQYRKVYEHMATGAQELCDSSEDHPELAALRDGLLAAALATDIAQDGEDVGEVVDAERGADTDADGDGRPEAAGAEAEDRAVAGETAPEGEDEAGVHAEPAAEEEPDVRSTDAGGAGAEQDDRTAAGEVTSDVAASAEEDAAKADAAASGNGAETVDETGDEPAARFDFGADIVAGAAPAAETDDAAAADADTAAGNGRETSAETGASEEEDDRESAAAVPGGQGWAERFRAASNPTDNAP